MRPILNLDIPALGKPGPKSFNAQPEAVRQWLAALPLGHVGESTRQIYAALHQVNRLDIDLRQRFEFLELMAPVVDTLLATLKKHYAGKPLPLEEKALRIAQLCTELMTAMVVGYQLVMAQSDGRHWLRQRKWETLWATALHRMLHYFSAIFGNYRMLHLPEPPGVWLRIHRGYRLSADNGLLDIAVPAVGGAEPSTTVDQAYKQLLVLAMLAPQRLRDSQMDEIHDNMALWSSGLELGVPAAMADCDGRYCIDFDEDTPPLPLWKLHAGREPAFGTVRALRMDRLLDGLQQQLRVQRLATRLVVSNGNTVSRDTLAAVVNACSRPPERSDKRKADGGKVHAVFGLREIHVLLNQLHAPVEAPVAVEAAADPLPDDAPPAVAKDRFQIEGTQSVEARTDAHWGFTAQRDSETDVWDMVYSGRAPEAEASWNEVAVSKSYRMLQGVVVDRSSGGVGLSFAAADVGRIKDGDLVAFNTTGNVSNWYIGCVRWISLKRDDRLEVGIKRLQQQAVPATVRTEQEGRRSAPIGCLLGPEQDQLRIVLPQMTVLENKPLLLESGGHEARIVLLEQLDGSPAYRMFRFMEKQEPAAQANKQQEKSAPKDEFDRFKSLWDIL